MTDTLGQARRRYAEEVAGGTGCLDLVEAFACVPRERFLTPGPWTLIDSTLQPKPTPDGDPRHLYQNMVVAMDAAKSLNNGLPQFWAGLFAAVRPRPGDSVAHVGAGRGYYTAVLAELVTGGGRVRAFEYEPALATAAAQALADRPTVEVFSGDAHTLMDGMFDVIVASCGLDTVPVDWVGRLNDGGRLLIPLTATSTMDRIGAGAMLLVARRGQAFDAAFISPTWIYHDQAGRSAVSTSRLAEAFARPRTGGPGSLPSVRRLWLNGSPDASCWLAGDGWWLSTA